VVVDDGSMDVVFDLEVVSTTALIPISPNDLMLKFDVLEEIVLLSKALVVFVNLLRARIDG
jgi:hypothetical protein